MKKKKYTAIFIDGSLKTSKIRMEHLHCSISDVDAELHYIKHGYKVDLLFLFDGHLKNAGAEPSNPIG